MLGTYVWLDNMLYLEELARRGKAGYGDPYFEDLARRVGPILRERLSRAAEDAGSYWYTAWTRRRPARPEVSRPASRRRRGLTRARPSPYDRGSGVRLGTRRRAAGNEPLDEGKLSPSDAELIERCLRKDNAAWELVVARFRRKVFHIAYKFTGKHDEAEDLTQEIFLKVFRSLDKFNRDADFSTWLSSVARNYCIDHYRASKREKEVVVEDALAYDLAPASSGNPYRALEDQDRRSLVRRGLEQLPGKLREAVVLRDLQGLSYQEMALRLALPEGTVKSRINRGREELARLLLRAQQPARRGPGPRVGRRREVR